MWGRLAWVRMACRSSRKKEDCAAVHGVQPSSLARALAANALQAHIHPTFMPARKM